MTVADFIDKTSYSFRPKKKNNMISRSTNFDKAFFNKTLELGDGEV